MLIDLHAHFPMHVRPDGQLQRFSAPPRRSVPRFAFADGVQPDALTSTAALLGGVDHADEMLEWLILQAVCGVLDYNRFHPCTDIPRLLTGNVGVVLSALYWPPDELTHGLVGQPPEPGSLQRLLDQLRGVEEEIAPSPIKLARSYGDLRTLWDSNTPALVHAVEGGFALGTTPTEVADGVRQLAARGVAYITPAHLFWLHVATNIPALPFLHDSLYRKLFPEPDVGLTDLGRAAVQAMGENGILVDVTHMTERATLETFDLLDQVAGAPNAIPVLVSHGACLLPDGDRLAYNLDQNLVERIAARNGVIGLLLCEHYLAPGVRSTHSGIDRSIDILCAHIAQIKAWTGSDDIAAIGTDLDGFITTLPGMENASKLRDLEERLAKRIGADCARKVCSANALSILERGWTATPPVTA